MCLCAYFILQLSEFWFAAFKQMFSEYALSVEVNSSSSPSHNYRKYLQTLVRDFGELARNFV